MGLDAFASTRTGQLQLGGAKPRLTEVDEVVAFGFLHQPYRCYQRPHKWVACGRVGNSHIRSSEAAGPRARVAAAPATAAGEPATDPLATIAIQPNTIAAMMSSLFMGSSTAPRTVPIALAGGENPGAQVWMIAGLGRTGNRVAAPLAGRMWAQEIT